MHDVFSECLAEILYKTFHICLGTFREILLHIKLADAFSHNALDCAE